MKRQISLFDLYVFHRAYPVLARFHLEYCVQSWAPWLRRDITKVEGVQRLAIRMVQAFQHLFYPERLRALNRYSIERRLLRGDLIETFKLFQGKTKLDPWDLFEPLPEGMDRRRHPWAIFKPHCVTTIHQKLFTQRILNAWNKLPGNVLYSRYVDVFKSRFAAAWHLIAPDLL